MAMTIVVTRNVPTRVRGFLASCMCEIAPGVYTGPRMTPPIRERIWAVMLDWHEPEPDRSVVMTWPDESEPGGQQVRVLGAPRIELAEHHGVFLAKRPVDSGLLKCLEVGVEAPLALDMVENLLIIDSETTGLGESAEVIALVALSFDGDVVVNVEVFPAGPIEAAATKVHGLTTARLKGAPRFPDVHAMLCAKLQGRRLLAWNASFDRRVLEQTCARYRLAPPAVEWTCLLDRYEAWRGLRCSLATACQLERLASVPSHSALADAQALLALFRRMAGLAPVAL